MKHWAWRAGLALIVAAAVGVAQQAGLNRAAAAGAYTGSTGIVPATRVIVFHPKGTSGAPVAGSCGMGEAQAVDRADAWRCIVGNIIYDPCFSTSPHATSVICGASPQRPVGIRVTLAQPLPTHAPARGKQAWILLLGDGTTCTFATGATFGVQNQRANYYCSDKDWLIGDPQPGRIWYAVKAHLAPKPGPNGPTASHLFAISVATVWK